MKLTLATLSLVLAMISTDVLQEVGELWITFESFLHSCFHLCSVTVPFKLWLFFFSLLILLNYNLIDMLNI